MRNEIVKLAIDLAKGKVQNFSTQESNETLRKAFLDLMEYSTEGNGKIDFKTFRRHQVAIFEILEVVLNEVIEEGLRAQFDDFADYRNLAWGDENLFTVPENSIFRVSLISNGNGNLRRQKLKDGQEFSVGVSTYGVKVGDDFLRFLAGRVNWVDFVNGVAESFKRDLTQRIYDAIYASYGKFNTIYHNSGSLTEDKIVEMAEHIKARTGEDVAIYGTKLALRKLAPSNISENMKDSKNSVGYYGQVAGVELREIAQSHKYGTDEFAIDNNMLLILPLNKDKMVKIVNEGNAIIQEQKGGETADMMQDYTVINRFGIAVICSKVFGFWKIG